MKHDPHKEFHQYKKHVQKRLQDLRPIFARLAVGEPPADVSVLDIDLDDEFSELYAGIETLIEVARSYASQCGELDRTLEERATERAFLLERAQDLAHIGSWRLDLDTNIMHWSSELYRMFSISPEGFTPSLGVYVSRTHPEDRDYVRRVFDTAIQEERPLYSFNHRIVCPKNVERTVRTVVGVSKNTSGCGGYVYGATQDITDLELAHQNLRLLSTAVKQTPDMIFVTNKQGEFLYVNKAFEKLTGYSLEEVVGKTPRILQSGRHDQQFYKDFWKTILSGKVFIGEFVNQKKSGELYYAKKSVAPLMDDNGNITHFVSTGQDITAQKNAQEALKRSHRQLERTVKERTKELRASNALLQKEIAARDTFIALLSHELRNPLAPVLNSLDLLRMKGSHDPETSRALAIMERQVMNIKQLLGDLLDVSRITRGQIKLNKTSVDIRTVLEQAYETVSSMIEERKHTIHIAMPKNALILCADPLRLEQVIVNLLSNATKYTPHGGEIFLTCTREKEHAVVRVRDTGIGIQPDLLPQIFGLFERQPVSHSHSEGGLGIGLTLVETLVKMHNGTVTAKSDGVGKGSEFEVKFPLDQNWEPTADMRKEVSSHSPGALGTCDQNISGTKVLVVEDNVDLAGALGTLLEMIGCKTDIAYNAEEALLSLADNAPDIIFMDIGLPGLNGYELSRKIRGQGLSKVPIIALSGYGQSQDIQHSKDAGIDLHLVKPIGVSTIKKVLSSFVNS